MLSVHVLDAWRRRLRCRAVLDYHGTYYGRCKRKRRHEGMHVLRWNGSDIYFTTRVVR